MNQKQNITKTNKKKVYTTNLYALLEKEILANFISLSGPPDLDLKYTVSQVFNLHDPLNIIPLKTTLDL